MDISLEETPQYQFKLFLNFCWSVLFFKYKQFGLALIEIILMRISILTMVLVFKIINLQNAYLQMPYLAWVSLTMVLNASI